ncbi:hypothetical protein [Sphingomonas lycopersici]|uniref:Uncharacterized protein n=1 Tax=Sphingomonas lycopersici TaxID=2951807 RepID=A0AA41ZBX6_9SPHN|nr:hypothetical protein [Sphingomonas lycopersici]MCW6533801.1 hypothetical protein [Sphingomonas lycopersici]
MEVWCFSDARGLGALTADENGANLPVELGPWHLIAGLSLSEEHADEREARRLIVEHGFCWFGEKLRS